MSWLLFLPGICIRNRYSWQNPWPFNKISWFCVNVIVASLLKSIQYYHSVQKASVSLCRSELFFTVCCCKLNGICMGSALFTMKARLTWTLCIRSVHSSHSVTLLLYKKQSCECSSFRSQAEGGHFKNDYLIALKLF